MSHAHLPARRFVIAILAALALALVALFPTVAAANGKDNANHGKGKVVGVMTRNLYLGADLLPAFGATSLEAFTEATGQIAREVTANDFPVRAKGLAREILSQKPDLVGLQEVALWRTGPPSMAWLQTGPTATTVRYDFLHELLDQLNKGSNGQGEGKATGAAHYRVVVSENETDVEAPADENGVAGDGPAAEGIPNAELNIRFTDRDVILERLGAGVTVKDTSGGHFAHLAMVSILGHTFPITRGWTAADVKVRGSHQFRFVNTHLEAYEPVARTQQAEELVASGGPATSTSGPVILAGDLNSDDDTVTPPNRVAYETLINAGFKERSTNNPLSCCINSSLLAEGAGGSISDFNHQVDHVLTSDPAVTLVGSAVTGLEPVNGFWDSDHAGLFSALQFPY